MTSFEDRLRQINQAIWSTPPGDLPRWKARAVRAARMVVVIVRDVFDGELTLWTMSLVYTTLLSMVPLLALSFSVLKGFGVHNQIGPLLSNLLAPLGERGAEVTQRLIGFIDQMNVGVLGAVGLALLLYTVVSLMQKIERAFNAVWHVSEMRGLGERFTRYLSALLVGPILVFAALGVTAMAVNSEVVRSLVEIEPFGIGLFVLGKLAPYVLIIGAFTFFYMFIPNTRVRLGPACVGATVAGILWQSAGWAFAVFVASSARYAAIYSGFAVLVLFMIWLYLSWLILLIGVAISFYVQHPESLYAAPGQPRLSNRMRERLALGVMCLVGARFVRGEEAWTLSGLTRRLAVPTYAVEVAVGALVAAGLLVRTQGTPAAYVPGRDLAEIPLSEVLSAIRAAGERQFIHPRSVVLPDAVDEALARVDDALAAALAGTSIRDVVDRIDREADAGPAADRPPIPVHHEGSGSAGP